MVSFTLCHLQKNEDCQGFFKRSHPSCQYQKASNQVWNQQTRYGEEARREQDIEALYAALRREIPCLFDSHQCFWVGFAQGMVKQIGVTSNKEERVW